MKRDTIDILSVDLEESDCEVEEIDLTESAMYKRAFKKFYYQQKKGKNMLEENEDYDCEDIEEDDEEIEEDELDLEDEDIEIEEEDLQ